MHRNKLRELLNTYAPTAHEEIQFRDQMISFINEHPDCFERTLAIGHITGSAFILDKTGTHALLLHHTKLDKWFQLGGHCDGDSDVLTVALKEAQEESGIMGIEPVSIEIFDIDIHRIPERKHEPAHDHYDVRFLLQVVSDEQLVQNAESKELRWIGKDAQDLPTDNPSVVRMFKKWMPMKLQIILIGALLLTGASCFAMEKVYNPKPLTMICFEAYAPTFVSKTLPAMCTELAEKLATEFPCDSLNAPLDPADAITQLLAMSKIECRNSIVCITPFSLECTTITDLTTQFNNLAQNKFDNPVFSRLQNKQCGLLQRCLEEVTLEFYTGDTKDEFAAFKAEHPALGQIIETKMQTIETLINTKCQLPERRGLRKQLAQFDDMLNHCDLLERLGGKEFTTLATGGQFQMALGDYREYLQKHKNYTKGDSIQEGARIQRELLPVLLKDYPQEFEALKATMEKETRKLIAKENRKFNLLKMPNEKILRERLQQPPLDHLASHTTTFTRFAGKSFTYAELFKEVDAIKKEYERYLIKGGQHQMLASLTADMITKLLLDALVQDYPIIVKLLGKARYEPHNN